MKKIALEEHFTTPQLRGYVYGPHSSMDRKLFAQFEERLLEFDQMRLAAMDRAGIELAVLSASTPGVQAERDLEIAVDRARAANDLLAAQIEKHPDRFAGFAHLPLQDAHAAADEFCALR